MWILVQKELVQLRSYLRQILIFLTLAALLFAKSAPEMLMAYFFVFPVVTALTLPQLSFTLEERGNTFVFLRSLPIRPWEIVASKYMISVFVIFGFVILLFVFGAWAGPGAGDLAGNISAVVLLSSLFASLSYLFHFWLGIKRAKTVLIALTLAAAIPTMLSAKNPQGVEAFLQSANLRWLVEVARSPEGVVLASLAGLLLILLSFAVSSWIFARRDVTRLP